MHKIRAFDYFQVEFTRDESIPGPNTKCCACHQALHTRHLKIILQRDYLNGKGVRTPVYFCKDCAFKVAATILQLVEG